MGIFEFWIILFIVLIIFALILPFISIYFFALSALCISVLVKFFNIGLYSQFTILSILSFFWFSIILYINKTKIQSPNKKYFDIEGKIVKVKSDQIDASNIGLVVWSGTNFHAKMEKLHEIAVKDEMIKISKIEGNILICIKIN